MYCLERILIFFIAIASLIDLSRCKLDFDLAKMRDKIMSRDPQETLDISIVSEIILKIDELLSMEEYQDFVNANALLKSDLNRIMTIAKPIEGECNLGVLRFRLAQQRKIGPEYVNLHPYLHLLNGIQSSRCMYNVDLKMNDVYQQLSNSERERIHSIYERARLQESPSYIGVKPLNGYNSDDPSTNLEARQFIMVAALFAEEEIFRQYEEDILPIYAPSDFVDAFRVDYQNSVLRPCWRFYRLTDLRPDDIEFIAEVRSKFGISSIHDTEVMITFCRYLGSGPNEYKKVYQFYMRHLANRSPKIDYPNNLIHVVMMPLNISAENKMLTDALQNDEISMFGLTNPKELKNQLIRYEYQYHLLNLGSVNVDNLIDLGTVSIRKCESVLLSIMMRFSKIYLNSKNPAMMPFIMQYNKHQYKICEEQFWFSIGQAFETTEFNFLVQLEQLRIFLRQNKDTSGISRSTKLDTEKIQIAIADLLYITKYPLPQGMEMRDALRNLMRQICQNYHNALSASAVQRSKTLSVLFEPLIVDTLQFDFSPLTSSGIIYEFLCRHYYVEFPFQDFVSSIGKYLKNSHRRVKSYSEVLETMKLSA